MGASRGASRGRRGGARRGSTGILPASARGSRASSVAPRADLLSGHRKSRRAGERALRYVPCATGILPVPGHGRDGHGTFTTSSGRTPGARTTSGIGRDLSTRGSRRCVRRGRSPPIHRGGFSPLAARACSVSITASQWRVTGKQSEVRRAGIRGWRLGIGGRRLRTLRGIGDSRFKIQKWRDAENRQSASP